MQAIYLHDATGSLEGSVGSRASQSPDGFCKGLGHGGLSHVGATQQGQSAVPAPGTKVRHRWQDGEKVVILSILLIQWEQ